MQPLPACLTIKALFDDYRQGRRLPSEVMAAVLNRIQSNDQSGIWISRSPRAVILERVAMLEAELLRDPVAALAAKPLLGIPYAVKDNIDVQGMQTTVGCPGFAYSAAESADVVARLDAAGAIMLGKCNLDQFATGLVGTRSPYGKAGNPFDPAYIAGGSSTGSALATALGLVAFALGTDTAGSGRIPAAFCNLVGLKPTPGLVSNRGVFPACRSLDCVSIFAHTVADAWQVLSIGANTDDMHIKIPAMCGPLTRKVALGIPSVPEFYGDGQARRAFEGTLAALSENSSYKIDSIDMTPFDAVAALLYDGPWIAERRAAIGDFFDEHAESIDPTVRRVILAADSVTAADVFHGHYRLAELKRQCEAVFKTIDVLIVPTAPTIFRHEEIAGDPLGLNSRLGKYTNFVNLLGLAALALPSPFREDGLPVGITLLGPGGSDHRLAELGRRMEFSLHQRLGITNMQPPRQLRALPPLSIAADPGIEVAVVGAHLAGLPLNWQLLERGARLEQTTTTAAEYRLYALPGTVPPKPGLLRVATGGAAIDVEVWRMPLRQFGSFVAEVPPPMAIGNLKLASNHEVKGFLCEPVAIAAATDITGFGGWRAYLASCSPTAAGGEPMLNRN